MAHGLRVACYDQGHRRMSFQHVQACTGGPNFMRAMFNCHRAGDV